MDTWRVFPDSERPHWALDPFRSVGPLRFGMTPDEASSVLNETAISRRRYGPGQGNMTSHDYPRPAVILYHASDNGLRGICVDALRGPQIIVDGRPLAGQVPSEIDQWVEERAKDRDDRAEIAYLGTGDIVSRTLGVAFCVQRAGDRLVTRPVFLSDPEMEDVHHLLPAEAWSNLWGSLCVGA